MSLIRNTLFVVIGIIFPVIAFCQGNYNLDFNKFNPIEQKMPTGWFKWGNFKSLTGEYISEENVAGKVVSDKEGKFGCITYRIPANYVGDTITLTGRFKHEKVKGFVGLLMRIDGYTKKSMLAFNSMQKMKIEGTNDWKEYSIKLPFPQNAKYIFVGGILGGEGTAWFDDFRVTIDGENIETLKKTEKMMLGDYSHNVWETALSNSSEELDFTNKETLYESVDPLIAKVGNKKIVSIGESTHGTAEFYVLREIITKRLIKEKGFNLVVLENPYDDLEVLNKNLYSQPLDTLIRKHLFSIYQTKEMKSFLKWYKDNKLTYNISLKGCDDSYWVSLELLKQHIAPIKDKELHKLMKKLEADIAKGSKANFKKGRKIKVSAYNDLLAIENHLKATSNLSKLLEETLFNMKNSYINYVHLANKKPIQSRDEIMADRISFLAKAPENKIIVWAHNAHISNEVIIDNEIGIMGRDLKKEFGNDYHSIGLMTLAGSYSYIDEKFINGDHIYTEKLQNEDILPVQDQLWEKTIAQNGTSVYIDVSGFQNAMGTTELIGPTKLIGYSKESEKDIYYLQITKNFDSLIFVEETSSTTPVLE